MVKTGVLRRLRFGSEGFSSALDVVCPDCANWLCTPRASSLSLRVFDSARRRVSGVDLPSCFHAPRISVIPRFRVPSNAVPAVRIVMRT